MLLDSDEAEPNSTFPWKSLPAAERQSLLLGPRPHGTPNSLAATVPQPMLTSTVRMIDTTAANLGGPRGSRKPWTQHFDAAELMAAVELVAAMKHRAAVRTFARSAAVRRRPSRLGARKGGLVANGVQESQPISRSGVRRISPASGYTIALHERILPDGVAAREPRGGSPPQPTQLTRLSGPERELRFALPVTTPDFVPSSLEYDGDAETWRLAAGLRFSTTETSWRRGARWPLTNGSVGSEATKTATTSLSTCRGGSSHPSLHAAQKGEGFSEAAASCATTEGNPHEDGDGDDDDVAAEPQLFFPAASCRFLCTRDTEVLSLRAVGVFDPHRLPKATDGHLSLRAETVESLSRDVSCMMECSDDAARAYVRRLRIQTPCDMAGCLLSRNHDAM